MAQKRLINWQDSMEITRNCFIQTEDYFIDGLRDVIHAGLTSYNYGLLPDEGSRKNDEGIKITQHGTGQIEILLLSCNAVTSSGLRINFQPENESGALVKVYSPEREGNLSVEILDIIVSVDPFRRRPTGEPDINETPPRHPDTEPLLELHVVPAGEINTRSFGSHYLVIGRIRREGDRYVVDHHYIPPCNRIAGHTALRDYHKRFGYMLRNLEESAQEIIQKVHERANKSDLASHIRELSEQLARYIASIYFDYHNRGLYYAPIELQERFARLAHILYANLNFFKKSTKEELLTYMYEWSNVTPGSFEQLLSDTLGQLYDHHNIRGMMVQTESFMHVLTELWERMSQLEYIGQHKESIVVSERREQIPEEGKKSGWNLLGN